MIIKSISQIRSAPLFFNLAEFIPKASTYVKLEGLNVAGSIKLTTALGLLDSLEKEGKITKDTKIIESSSGNLGVALSVACKERGYFFNCVTDPNILPENESLIRLYGGKVTKITEFDANGGYLASRIKYIEELLILDPTYIWLNQYANPQNPHAHYSLTAKEILNEFPQTDFLFIGAGTTGTLMGCAAFFKRNSPLTKIIAVDSVGSVTFGYPPKKRFIPGVGTSRRPEIVDERMIDELLLVDEKDAVQMCRKLLSSYGLFLGGSSGSVMHGIFSYQAKIAPGSIVVGISPDFGHKYMKTVYDDDWVNDKFSLKF